MKSEIFEEYYKISVAKEDEEKAKPKKNPRDNNMSPKELAELYGLKPETHQNMEYDYNMVEIAHPESLIISPSYDPLNGLYGNQNENHARIKHVVQREPRGLHDGHISARAELISTLIKTANYMDALDNEELCTLSDICLQTISNQDITINKLLNKKAFAVPAAVKAISALIGIWQGANALQTFLPKSDTGMGSSFNHLIKIIDDVKESNTNFGVGVEFKQSFKNILDQIKKTVIDFQSIYDQHSDLITSVQIANASDLFNKKQEINKSEEAMISLNENSLKMREFLDKVIKLLENSSFINNQVFEKGTLTSLVEENKVFDFVNSLINPFSSNAINPLIDAVKNYTASVNSLLDSLSGAFQNKEKVQVEVETELGKLPEFNSMDNPYTKPTEEKSDFDIKDFFN